MSVGPLQKMLGMGQATACLAASRYAQSSVRILGGFRTLYAADAMGVDGYEKQRERTKMQFTGMSDKFRAKMVEFSTSDSKNMIFTEDLKNMLHLVEGNPEDLGLVLEMMKKFNQQNKHLRFGNFVFGPVVMRMYHHLNDPKSALDAFNDPALEGFFDQLASYQILLDLLYRNKMYQEVLDAFEVIKTRQVQMTKYPRNVMVLVFATLHKLNTVQSYELACKLLTEMKDVGVEPVRRTITYACALAVNQNSPNVALEVLSNVQNTNYVSVRNLKMLALADIGRPDDALPILRYSLEFDNPTGDTTKATVCPDVMEKIAEAVQKLGNTEVTADFQKIEKALKETGQIGKDTLHTILEGEIRGRVNIPGQGPPFQGDRGGDNMRRQNMERSFRIGRSIDMKPRRNPMYERERRSLQSD